MKNQLRSHMPEGVFREHEIQRGSIIGSKTCTQKVYKKDKIYFVVSRKHLSYGKIFIIIIFKQDIIIFR